LFGACRKNLLVDIFCFGQAPFEGHLGALFCTALTGQNDFYHKRGSGSNKIVIITGGKNLKFRQFLTIRPLHFNFNPKTGIF
jgi:hypothetical protein